MLFILAMEPLHKMFQLAASCALLTPLAKAGMQQRLSLFGDDVMLFIKPIEADLCTSPWILQCFGEASGLRVNLTKSTTFPIICTTADMERVEQFLGCSMGTYPCKYLGLPLSMRKQTLAQLMGLVDCLMRKLPTWRAASMPNIGRLLLIKSVLCATTIHAMMVLDIP